MLLSVLIFGVIVMSFAIGLTPDLKKLPSVLIGKSTPKFNLPPVEARNSACQTRICLGRSQWLTCGLHGALSTALNIHS